ncbi:hypothetical protein FHY31_003811 [Xanthomonas euvesicatoria]|uniref:Uncharacterized protein n=1 Tax=Xanthomonas euvesicatoria TaxID=456327 RepID=A0AAW3UAV0_XANEU|nr:hypothetical protein [Xanthomonas euvesicatoria]MBB4872002.1 hypothetical protein [Xanthomonas euvesicatoria]
MGGRKARFLPPYAARRFPQGHFLFHPKFTIVSDKVDGVKPLSVSEC